MHDLVNLAKRSVEEYVRHGRLIPVPEPLTGELAEKAGVFVSIKKQGRLRGCIGTFMPSQENVASEIIRNAVSAATRDPRFSPVGPDELADLQYSVDVLEPPEEVNDAASLDPRVYGVITISGHKKGLLLPALEGVDTVDEQLRIAKMKAGIDDTEDIAIFRFRVRRYH